MRPINVVVSWPAGQARPEVDQETVNVPKGAGATVITWVCGENVRRLKIDGLDPTVFTPPASNGMAPRFSTTDANRVAGIYTYTFDAEQMTGASAAADPKIQNGG